ncbi:MAG: hypothetical protein M3P40_05665 [Actinomycetota bacterium]|nr:hypothetical protein [Actinomycetota bacterium]
MSDTERVVQEVCDEGRGDRGGRGGQHGDARDDEQPQAEQFLDRAPLPRAS